MGTGGGGGGSAPDYAALAASNERIYDKNVALAQPWTDAGTQRALPVILHELGLGPKPYLTADGRTVYSNDGSTLMGSGGSPSPAGANPFQQELDELSRYRLDYIGAPDSDISGNFAKVYRHSDGSTISEQEYEDRRRRAEDRSAVFAAQAGQGGSAFGGALPEGATPLGGYTATPGYAFRMQEGERTLMSGLNAAGAGKDSGATYKALTRYGQDYATNEYQNYLNRLGQVAGYGQFGTSAAIGAGQQYQQGQLQIAGMQQSAYDNAQAQQQSALGGFGQLLGTAAGFAFGGPAGASIGGTIGGGMGGKFNGLFK